MVGEGISIMGSPGEDVWEGCDGALAFGLAVPFMTSEKRWLSPLPQAEGRGSTGRSSATGAVGSSGDAPGSGGNAVVSRSKCECGEPIESGCCGCDLFAMSLLPGSCVGGPRGPCPLPRPPGPIPIISSSSRGRRRPRPPPRDLG